MQKIWEEVKGHVKGRAVRGADGWTVETPGIEDWTSLMQFKQNKKIVDTSKTEHEWKQWLVKMKDKPVYLVIYEYGSIIGRQQELDDFTAACIRPLHTDRSGATAEASLRDVADQVVWRMWANHITRNLNRSTWDAAVSSHPPPYIAQLMQPVDNHHGSHLTNLARSANMALDCVVASIADLNQLRRHLDTCESNLNTRKSIVEAFIRDIPPPPAHAVIDPLEHMENVPDTEHQDN
ncbi:hypothetical protein AaE_014218 [Aphanomyces astaci]|uniref:Uncharacterized protein n=1 Tax=Aphanomyces astaci TaxID=112090 RepID=A0A6A4Z719_APHAT|nr:hypothetical protein AaE_014218 [Aphanomyces astaci]